MFYLLFPTFFILFLLKGLCLVPLQNDTESKHQVATRLVRAEVQSLVLCHKDKKACSTAAIGQMALRIVAFVFKMAIKGTGINQLL